MFNILVKLLMSLADVYMLSPAQPQGLVRTRLKN